MGHPRRPSNEERGMGTGPTQGLSTLHGPSKLMVPLFERRSLTNDPETNQSLSIADDDDTTLVADSLEGAIQQVEGERLQMVQRFTLGQHFVGGYERAVQRGRPLLPNIDADVQAGAPLQRGVGRRHREAESVAADVASEKIRVPVRG